MSNALNKSRILGGTSHLLRVVGGVALGFCIYYVAYNYASVDCQTMQSANLSAGANAALKITSLLILIASLGVPSSICGIIAGLILGPTIGGPLASLAIVIASITDCP